MAIRKRTALGSWLHGVAYRLARKLRTADARRRAREIQIDNTLVPSPDTEASWREVQAALDEELMRLPEKYRAPLVLCYLEERTRDEAACQLALSPTTLRGRLEQGRNLLRSRLARRGVVLSSALLVPALAAAAGGDLIPTSLVDSAVGAAVGRSSGAAARAAALAEGAVKTMTRSKLILAVAFVLIVGFGAVGVAVYPLSGAPDAQAPTAEGQKGTGKDPGEEKPSRTAAGRKDRHGDPLPPNAIARLGTVRLRHEGTGAALVFAPDGKVVAAACGTGVILWDAATGKELRRLPVNATGRGVRPLDFSPDGKALAVAGRSADGGGAITFWDPATGKELRSLPVPDDGRPGGGAGVCFSPCGKTLAVGNGGDQVHLIDVPTGKVRHALGGHRAAVYGLAFSPDGKTIALGTLRPGVQLWDVAKGKLVRGIDCHNDVFVHSVAFSPDGKVIASGSWDRIVLSEAATGKERARFEAKMQSISGLAFTADGRTLVSGSQDGWVRLWDVATRRARLTLDGGWGSGGSLALSPVGNTVASASASAIHLWDAATGKKRFPELEGADAPVRALVFTRDGKCLLSGGDGQSRVWDAATWQPLRVLPGTARNLSLTPDDKQLATVAYTPAFRIRELATGRDVLTVKVPELRLAAFAPDGKTVVSVECKWPDSGSTRVSRWDAATGKRLCQVPALRVLPYCFAVSPDGRTAVVGGGEGAIRVCDLDAGKEVLTLHGHQTIVEALAFSRDGRTLASGSCGDYDSTRERWHDRSVRLWELVTGREIAVLEGHVRAVGAVALSPDGRLVASADGVDHGYEGNEPRRIRVWDVAAGREVARFEGHSSTVRALAFSPDGKRLLSAQQNSTVLVWDVTGVARPGQGGKVQRLDALWEDLAGDDAGKAHRAGWALTDDPDRAVPFLKDRLRPAKEEEQERIRRLLMDVESERFAVRDAAVRALKDLGDHAEAAVRQALEGKLPLETRRRLEGVHAALRVPSREALRRVRAVAVLERVGSAEARRVLEALAGGAPRLRQTQEAQAALQRLAEWSVAP
jgi:WD40 repeat protein